jgi:two-component system, NarL family, sensor kinase
MKPKVTRKSNRSRKPTPRLSLKRRPLGQVRESEQIVLAIRHGKIDALVMTGSDGEQVVTLQGSDQPYRVVLEAINDGAATLDHSGTVLYANSRFAEILRVPEGSLIGTTLQNYLSPSTFEKLQRLIAQGLTTDARGEITLESSEGRPRLVRLALKPMRNTEQTNVCLVATELTELVEANEALRSNEESLRQLSARLLKLQDEERRHIARDLHDITGQKLAAQSMALAKVLRKAAGLDQESQRLLVECVTLSNQVSDEIRTLSYLLHPPLLDELGLSSAVRWYAEGYERRTGIKVEVKIPLDFGRLSPDVEVALFRVMQESLSNVQRYSESPRAYVRLKRLSSDEIQVQIGDFGKGMHPATLNTSTHTAAPLGVGIQGMRERMRQLGGKLEITSRLKHGTLVTATLPMVHPQANPSAESITDTTVESATNRGTDTPAPGRDTPRKQILIADDHEMLRRGIRNALEDRQDWQICGEAVDGQEAVNKVNTLRPDLVILDINMPVLNGLAAVRQILRNRPQTKIVIFTVHDSEQTIKEIHAAGAHAYVSKNDASDALLRVVEDLLESKRVASTAVGNSTN